jgi:hypothetical protein
MRSGEKRVIYGQVIVDIGTLTITGSPTFVLIDSNSVTVSSGAATGYDNTATASPRVWYTLNVSALGSGSYELTFTFSATSSADSITRIYQSLIGVIVC